MFYESECIVLQGQWIAGLWMIETVAVYQKSILSFIGQQQLSKSISSQLDTIKTHRLNRDIVCVSDNTLRQSPKSYISWHSMCTDVHRCVCTGHINDVCTDNEWVWVQMYNAVRFTIVCTVSSYVQHHRVIAKAIFYPKKSKNQILFHRICHRPAVKMMLTTIKHRLTKCTHCYHWRENAIATKENWRKPNRSYAWNERLFR